MTAIVDLVLTPPPRSRRGPALVIAIAVHAALLVTALGVRPSLEGWSADLAARIHADLTRVEAIDIPPAPPPEPEPEPAEPPPAPAAQPAAPPPPAPRSPPVRVKVHNPPAHAGRVLTAAPGALDLTGDVVVQGTASGYAGGATSQSGTGTAPGTAAPPTPPSPATPPATPAPHRPATPDLSTPVSLPFDEWSCPWPDAALDLAIDEQTAVIRVTVGPDGRIEASRVVTDPGDGFGAAALECARNARLIPARDRDGKPVRATATARLRFYR